MSPVPTPQMETRWPGQLAAIDMGSNSFRLEIAQVPHGRYRRVDYLKETVRLGAGLDANGLLTEEAAQRGLACLARFAQRLHKALESYNIPTALGRFDLLGGGGNDNLVTDKLMRMVGGPAAINAHLVNSRKTPGAKQQESTSRRAGQSESGKCPNGGDDHPLDQLVWILVNDLAVLERARLGFVGVDDQVHRRHELDLLGVGEAHHDLIVFLGDLQILAVDRSDRVFDLLGLVERCADLGHRGAALAGDQFIMAPGFQHSPLVDHINAIQ